MGSGTEVDPWTLKEALSSGQIEPGDRVLLRGGTYSNLGNLNCDLNGEEKSPVQFVAYPGERPIIDNASLIVTSSDVWWYGVEFTDTTFTDRVSTQETSSPTDIDGRTIIAADSGNRFKFISCHIHNSRQISNGSSAIDTEWNACCFYYNGWKSPSNSYGHGIYPQNNQPTKLIKNCILHDNFGYGLHAFAVEGTLDNFTISNNVSFCNGSLWGRFYSDLFIGGVDYDSLNLLNNLTYETDDYNGGGNQIGYGETTNLTNASILDNIFAREDLADVNGRIFVLAGGATPDTMSGNKFYGNVVGFTSDDYPDNTYGSVGAYGDQQFVYAHDYVVIDDNGDGLKDKIVAVGASNSADKANVTIYNQSQENTVDVDVSSVFDNGTDLNVRNAQDYFNDVQSLTVSGGTITINMQAANRSVETPVGSGISSPPKTFPNFGCFVLERQ